MTKKTTKTSGPSFILGSKRRAIWDTWEQRLRRLSVNSGRPLTEEEKQANRQFSRQRITVEHTIGKMKIFKILSDRFRNPLKDHTIIFKNIAGLHNLMFA